MARLAPPPAPQQRPLYTVHQSTPVFHSLAARPSLHAHAHGHASSSSSSHIHPMPFLASPAHSAPMSIPIHAESSRPRCPKKPSGSTANRRQAVQLSLEAQVQRTKCLFVPLCRGVPAPPPSSPVARPVGELHSAPTTLGSRDSGEMARQQEGEDYFGKMWEKGMEVWCEHVPHAEKQDHGMDVDQ